MLDLKFAEREHKQILKSIRENTVIALDWETTGLDPWVEYARPCGLSLAWGEHPWEGCYYPIGHLDGNNVPVDWVREAWELLVEQNKLVLIFNAQFDIKMGMVSKLPDLPRVMDVLGTAHLTDENLPQHRLDYMAKMLMPAYASHKDVLAEYMKEHKLGRYHEVPVEIMRPYGIADTTMTVGIWNRLKDQLVREKLVEVQKVENRLTTTMARMEAGGVYVDIDYTKRGLSALEAGIGLLQTRLDEYFPGLNVNSNPQLTEAFHSIGIHSPLLTDSGNEGWGSSALAMIDHPMATTVSQFRSFRKLKDTYFGDLLRRATLASGDGCIHPSFKAHGARTGRFSCADPNLQNLPKYGRAAIAQTTGDDDEGDLAWISDDIAEAASDDDSMKKLLAEFGRVDSMEGIKAAMADTHDEDAISVRRILRARPGRTLIRMDYKQMEMAYFAHASADPAMVEIFANDKFDMHTDVARTVWPECRNFDPSSKEFAIFRRYAKSINFGILYGMGLKKLALQIGADEAQAEQFLKQYWAAFPIARAYIDWAYKRAERYGYVETFLGRRRRLDQHGAYRAVNAIIQGSCADIMKMALNNVDDYWLQNPGLGQSLFTVHDELVFEVEEGEEARVIKEIEPLMTNFATNPKLQVDTTLSISYGDKGKDLSDWLAQKAAA